MAAKPLDPIGAVRALRALLAERVAALSEIGITARRAVDEIESAIETAETNLEILTWEKDRLVAVAARREAAARLEAERKSQAAAERRAAEIAAELKKQARSNALLDEAKKAGLT